MLLRFAVSTALVLFTFALSAQQPPPGSGVPPPSPSPGLPTRLPPRAVRPGEDPNKGTAILRGYVTAADTSNPLRRAMVRAVSQDGRSGGMTTTDADGRFEIKDLLAGRYSLMASKAGYVQMSYGQRRPDQQGTLLEILDGQLVEKIAFTLLRGGVITGTILDEFGEPVAGANVSASRFRFFNGGRRLMPSGNATSDDRGMFRMYGLVPGDYYVSGALRSQQAMMVGVNTATASGPMDGYAPTYYPGTPNAGEASKVTVRAMQETGSVSFSLIATRLSRVSGRALSSAGAPVVQGMIMLMPADRLNSLGMILGNAMTRADGTFQILGVAAGSYSLQVRPRGNPTPDAEFANLRVTVGQDDLENVTVVTSRGAIARGLITTDESTPPSVRPQQVSLFARPMEPEVMIMGGAANVNDDWTFEITGLSEPRVITANIAESADWTLKSVLHNGVEAIDSPIDFVPGQMVEGLQLVFTRKRTEISGLITGERNLPDTDATVIVFSQDPSRWGYGTRYVRTARPSQDGRFSLRGMPPHDYFVVAVKEVEAGQWQDPEFLESMSRQAVRLSMLEGETKVQDLKVIRP
jgi:Carboxypeptidase regulatory-like domain